MIDILKTRLKQGHRTMAYPDGPAPEMPSRFTGCPVLGKELCNGCGDCRETCPSNAIEIINGKIQLDTGRCIFCGKCQAVCPSKAITFTRDFRLSALNRDELVMTGDPEARRTKFNDTVKKLFGRSLKLRQVSAGGCNACEADTNVLGTIAWDLGRFGIQFVAAPRHADGLLVTGPVTRNMELALRKTYEAVASPKIVIAVGACAVSGGLFRDHDETYKGAADIIPVDLFIPGCPPHPATILEGLLSLIGRLEQNAGS